jgi:hypothetical protein
MRSAQPQQLRAHEMGVDQPRARNVRARAIAMARVLAARVESVRREGDGGPVMHGLRIGRRAELLKFCGVLLQRTAAEPR